MNRWLRFCANITGLVSTVFYLHSLAKVTARTNGREKCAFTEALAKREKKVFKTCLCNCNADYVKIFFERTPNTINGKILFNVDRLLTYAKEVKVLCNAKTCDKKRRTSILIPITMSSQEFKVILQNN